MKPKQTEQQKLHMKIYMKTYRANHPEFVVRQRKLAKERARLRREAHPNCQAEYRERDPEETKKRDARYRKKHAVKRKAYWAEWGKENAEHLKAYRIAHRAEHASNVAARRSVILGVTIGNLGEIREIYRRAKEDHKVRCYLCGKLIPMGHRHVDHIMPLAKGGAHRPSNLAVACDVCNASKGAKLPEAIGVLL